MPFDFDWTDLATKENLLWEEDDAHPPGAETWREAWLRLFSEPVPYMRDCWASYDGGDYRAFWFPGGRILVHDAANGTSIYQTDIL